MPIRLFGPLRIPVFKPVLRLNAKRRPLRPIVGRLPPLGTPALRPHALYTERQQIGWARSGVRSLADPEIVDDRVESHHPSVGIRLLHARSHPVPVLFQRPGYASDLRA